MKQRDLQPTEVRLKLPCEVVVENLLTIVRKLLAEELVKNRGLSQLQTSRILGVTQPAVSSYVNSELKLRSPYMKDNVEELRKMTQLFAEDLLDGRLDQIEAMKRICSICVNLRSGGAICRIHSDEVPVLQHDHCSYCLKDLGEIRQVSMEDYDYIQQVRRVIQLLENSWETAPLIPEIGMNLVYAKSGAGSVEDVVGTPGRIHPIGGRPRASSMPAYGGSNHVARAVLTIMKYQPEFRSAVSLKFNWEFVEICRELGYRVSGFDRKEEPLEIKRVDGRTIQWGVSHTVEKFDGVPDVIYDTGDIGKEPMIFLFGGDPREVAQKTLRIAHEFEIRHKKKR